MPVQREEFAAQLAAARRMAGCSTLKAGAERLGVPYGTYTRWERGETEPSIPDLIRICRGYEVSADLLLGTGIGRRQLEPARRVRSA